MRTAWLATGSAEKPRSAGISLAVIFVPDSSTTPQRRSPASPHGSTSAPSTSMPPIDLTGDIRTAVTLIPLVSARRAACVLRADSKDLLDLPTVQAGIGVDLGPVMDVVLRHVDQDPPTWDRLRGVLTGH